MMRNNFWKPGKLAALVLVAALAIGALLVSGKMLVVQSIEVVGVGMVSQDEVIRLSGIKMGQAMMSVGESSIKQGVESNRFLRLSSVEKVFPSKIIICVETRYPLAALLHKGSYLMIDDDGFIISKQASLTLEGVPLLMGIEIPDALARVDACLLSEGTASSMGAALTALNELKVQNAISMISELNCLDLDNMYLVTIDGVQVKLGTSKNMEQKVLLARSVLPMLPESCKRSGLLDVTALNKADYINEPVVQTLSLDIIDYQTSADGI